MSIRVQDSEATAGELASRLNWLRAGVLGANDGIVSVAAVVVGVAGVTTDSMPILIAGLAAVIGGAISMALGEYVSVSSQTDSQRALLEKERAAHAANPKGQLERLARSYELKGLTPFTARSVAEELSAIDPIAAQASVGLGIEEDEVVSPWHAAIASAVAFFAGSVLPMLAILLPPAPLRVPITFVAVLIALGVTGWVAAWIGHSNTRRAAVRVMIGGAIALAATFGIGSWLNSLGVTI